MTIQEYGNRDANVVLIQPVDEHDLGGMENEVRLIARLCPMPFRLIAVKVDDWNRDLSPWPAPAVFGRADFGAGAADTLAEILPLCADKTKTYFIGGYSLAGLFALWAACRTDAFRGVAAASPSVWFPGFLEYMENHAVQSPVVYLSLGDKENRTRNPVMATVADRIQQVYDLLQARGVCGVLEWNPGNHFRDADVRTAKAFAWLMQQSDDGHDPNR